MNENLYHKSLVRVTDFLRPLEVIDHILRMFLLIYRGQIIEELIHFIKPTLIFLKIKDLNIPISYSAWIMPPHHVNYYQDKSARCLSSCQLLSEGSDKCAINFMPCQLFSKG
ncbi:hypothetical protein WUBG_10990 [Wuchereria bancrofti]|uniref:Uncharacterized protein n=1 Tax=Wuchereria bancrofti TaxID=6293 RepID=J9E742_WUCBA|nr:hypothetical protein WUBG_10990 [Wuchereria bancrofti]